MGIPLDFCIYKADAPYPIYDVDKGRVGTLYNRESFVIYGVEDYVTIVFLSPRGKLESATISIPNQEKFWPGVNFCTNFPYGQEIIDGNNYYTFKMRQRKNIYTAAGNYWGAVAANMLVATTNDRVGETHNDWKQINYVKRSTDGAWIKVEGDGYSHGYVDTGLSTASTYNTIPFYGSW